MHDPKKRKESLLVMLSLVICIIAGCSGDRVSDTGPAGIPPDSDTGNTAPAVNQRILFEVSFINHAWAFTFCGFYIDSGGNVYTFRYDRHDEPWNPVNSNRLTEAELMEKYSHQAAFVKTVDADTLQSMRALMAGAAQGTLSPPEHDHCDFGTVTHTAYLFDPDDDAYIPVLLYQYGDWTRENLSAEAHTLVDWLNSLAISFY